MEILTTTKAIRQALNQYPEKVVYCTVESPYEQPYIYQVFDVRTRYGSLEVKTINRWETPLSVYTAPGTGGHPFP